MRGKWRCGWHIVGTWNPKKPHNLILKACNILLRGPHWCHINETKLTHILGTASQILHGESVDGKTMVKYSY